ncbi:hypothetical protein KX442_30205 [Escherichia coli]|uniref:Plasmid protein n=1 Tax=Escherichia coli TaxID=562 RepID=A0A376VWQ1_ECOLX|nr:hypothetical protein ECDEC13D_3791 [Escherichia coli DEC13D]EHX71693.1 hypothetical protein ECDEC13C_5394 [Escherichia coli DEC13C]ENA42956.1 hypothetical protein ECP03018674_5320 [Escherichia coli P0301867.4]ENA45422.1 hypothetical protein ECP03018672_1927 [Escherichia coli P0301867.2]END18412.1 hypothetical protein ECP03018678_5194 [Escherichia coli P0301867.8]END84066.1 hypothetical protein ECP030186713_5374 [Escherichia coli P0301867.13]ENG90691.1 hypothetical protein ECP03018673_5345 
MNISTETREILRNYRAVINARRRELTSSPTFALRDSGGGFPLVGDG